MSPYEVLGVDEQDEEAAQQFGAQQLGWMGHANAASYGSNPFR